MSFNYCSSCGGKNSLTAKFCQNCGNSFAINTINSANKNVNTKKISQTIDIEEEIDPEDLEELPDIKDFKFTANVEKQKGMTLKELMGTGKPISKKQRRAMRPAPQNPKNFMEEWKKEAGFGSSRSKPTDIGE